MQWHCNNKREFSKEKDISLICSMLTLIHWRHAATTTTITTEKNNNNKYATEWKCNSVSLIWNFLL